MLQAFSKTYNHEGQAQVISYLKLSGKSIGLLINFNVVHRKDGIKRFVNGDGWKEVKGFNHEGHQGSRRKPVGWGLSCCFIFWKIGSIIYP